MNPENKQSRFEGKKEDDMDTGNDSDCDSEEFDEDDINDELNLPSALRDLSFLEKKELLNFKKTHNAREWEDEIFRRVGALERQIDYERLKRMTATTSGFSDSKVAKQGKNEKGRKPIVQSDSEESEEEEDGLVADAGDLSQSEDDDDDDLFDSDEEKEISQRPTKIGVEADEQEESSENEQYSGEETLKKKGKKLGKGRESQKKLRTKKRRSSRLASKYDSDEETEEEEGSDDEDDKVDFSDDDDRHDYNLKSIKDSHRRPRSDATELREKKAKFQFTSLDELKLYLQKKLPSELPIKPNDNAPAVTNDYRKIFLRRDDICKKLHEPYFEQYVTGCYVRYLIGVVDSVQFYRMCEIVGVDRGKRPYKLPPLSDGSIVETSVRLHLNNAGEIKESQKLEKLSNHGLQDKEIEFHVQGARNAPRRNSTSLFSDEDDKTDVTKRDVRIIKNRNQQLENFTYSHDDIAKMVAGQMGMNKLMTTEYVTAMTLLKKRLDEAMKKEDTSQIEFLNKEIKKLDNITEKQRQMFEQHAKKQTDINRRMRESNVTRDMDAGMRKRHEEQEAVAKGILPNAISDPFIRRETRPKILWNTQKKLELNKEKDKENRGNEKQTSLDEFSNTHQPRHSKKPRLQIDDRWAMTTQLSLAEVRKRVAGRLGVDPFEAAQVSKKERYLRKVCDGLPPIGSEARERLRGKNNKSLQDYILLLSSGSQHQEGEGSSE